MRFKNDTWMIVAKLLLLVLAAVLALLLFLTGCGSDPVSYQKINREYSIINIPYHGGELTCVEGHQGALACDFDRFYRTP